MYRPTFVPPKPNAKGKGNFYYFFVVKMPFAERAAELNVCTAPVTNILSQCQAGSSVTDFLLGQESLRCVDEPHYFTLSIKKKIWPCEDVHRHLTTSNERLCGWLNVVPLFASCYINRRLDSKTEGKVKVGAFNSSDNMTPQTTVD